MAMQQHIRNPIEWGWDSLKNTGRAMNSAGQTIDKQVTNSITTSQDHELMK